MVLKTELRRFSGAKVYPGKGIRFVRADSRVFLFANSKCKRYFHNRLKPSMLTWTALYRKQHKKDIAQEAIKKRQRTTRKPYTPDDAIVGPAPGGPFTEVLDLLVKPVHLLLEFKHLPTIGLGIRLQPSGSHTPTTPHSAAVDRGTTALSFGTWGLSKSS